MFTSTAYEALYQYIGLALHSRSIEIITSQKFFLALLLLIFGSIFFITALRFFKRYLPGTVVSRQSVPLSKFFTIVASLFLGISLLKVSSSTSVKTFQQVSWHTNPYVSQRIPLVQKEYKVSFVFDLLTRTSEEISRFFNQIVDSLFESTNSQTEAPSFFYRALIHASSKTIDDPNLKSKIGLYSEECFEPILPFIEQQNKADKLDGFFSNTKYLNDKLEEIRLETENGDITCLDLKEEMRTHLVSYALNKGKNTNPLITKHITSNVIENVTFSHFMISSMLVGEQLRKKEGFLGVQKGAQAPGAASRFFQYLSKLNPFSWDGWINFLRLDHLRGASMSAKRAEKFGELLSRAAHVAGFTKMLMIAIFPWLIFFVVAGRWKVLIYWFALFTSVSLWAPIWTLLYHIVTNIALSAEVMEAFGRLHDNVSLYSSQLITSRIYKMYSVYSWLQIILGPIPTVILAHQLAPLLRDTEQEHAPEGIKEITAVGVKVASPAK